MARVEGGTRGKTVIRTVIRTVISGGQVFAVVLVQFEGEGTYSSGLHTVMVTIKSGITVYCFGRGGQLRGETSFSATSGGSHTDP